MTTSVQTVTSPSRFDWIVGGDRRVEIRTEQVSPDCRLTVVQVEARRFIIVDDERQIVHEMTVDGYTVAWKAERALLRYMSR